MVISYYVKFHHVCAYCLKDMYVCVHLASEKITIKEQGKCVISNYKNSKMNGELAKNIKSQRYISNKNLEFHVL